MACADQPVQGTASTRPRELPNAEPRPPGELDALRRIWSPPRGIKFVTIINNNDHDEPDRCGGLRLAVYVTGPVSRSWWATVVPILVVSSIYACVIFSYLYLWTVSPEMWPHAAALSAASCPFAAAILLALSSAAVFYASRALERNALVRAAPGLLAAVALAVAGVIQDGRGVSASGLTRTESGYGDIVYPIFALEGFYVAVVALMALHTVARAGADKLNSIRRVTFDNTTLFWHYTVVQSVAGLALVGIVFETLPVLMVRACA